MLKYLSSVLLECVPPESSAPAGRLAKVAVLLPPWNLTLDHPAFISCYPDNRANTARCDCCGRVRGRFCARRYTEIIEGVSERITCNSLMHGTVYLVSVPSWRWYG